MNDILRFNDEYRFLSNFYPAVVSIDGLYYPSVEHGYQASKTLDHTSRLRFIEKDVTAGYAKRLGRTLCVRPDWEDVKLGIMEDLVRQKFNHSELQEKLLVTWPRQLVEGNDWHDNFWGSCNCFRCSKIGLHANHLGLILMKVRYELRNKT